MRIAILFTNHKSVVTWSYAFFVSCAFVSFYILWIEILKYYSYKYELWQYESIRSINRQKGILFLSSIWSICSESMWRKSWWRRWSCSETRSKMWRHRSMEWWHGSIVWQHWSVEWWHWSVESRTHEWPRHERTIHWTWWEEVWWHTMHHCGFRTLEMRKQISINMKWFSWCLP